MMEYCQKESFWEAAGSLVPARPDPMPKVAKTKGGRGKKGASSQDECQMVKKVSRLLR